ncbi:basement membrane-specific heparan sulfate proteoglycan core protein [Pempheris klunzingeri]|uniref:basement membrane-specific heparan sulfate proteoglycan core protein n=1 Tax=Pempheris klunzingeri TaxID=3127111 RepID=UPI00397ED312
MTQLSKTASTCAAQWKMCLIKVFSVIYFTAVCAANNPEDVTAMFEVSPTSPLPKSAVAPTDYEPPVPSLQRQSEWLDVFPSEKVELSCSVSGSSDWTFIWHRNGHEVQDTDPNVSLSAGGSVLTITAAAQMYSGNYSCKGNHKTKSATTAASNSVVLTVYENKPRPMLKRSSNYDKMFPGESITFTCTVDVSSGWEYLWYHDGNEIPASNKSTYIIGDITHPSSGQYHCKARRGKSPFYTEESDTTTLQVSDPPTPTLKLLTPWLDVFEEETVELGCEVNGSDWTFSWYQNQKLLEEDDILTLESEGSLLNITSASQIYQGGYTCKTHLESRRVSSGFSNAVDITVYENVPKPTLSKNPGFKQMYAGETVNFTCNVDVSSGWEYHWYRDGDDLRDTDKTISVQLSPSNRGPYVCMATRSTTSTESSEEITQEILEIPVPSLKLLTQWADVFPTESVRLSCGMDGSSDWTYMWHKDGHKVQADDVLSFDSNGATLTVSSASAAHAGKYTCKGHLNDRSVSSNFSSGLTLTVYDKRPTVILMQDPEYKVMFPGESVSLSCHINVSSGWEYLWYKDKNPLGKSGSNYLIGSKATTNGGSYTCQVKRGTNQVFLTDASQAIRLEVEENSPKPSMTQQPDVDKVYTGESVSFECKVELSSGWEYLWYKDGALLSSNSSSFNIHNANLLDSGTYSCMAIRYKTMYKTKYSDGWFLRISEIPVPSLKLLTPWVDVFPTESVRLSCGMDGSSDWTYMWHKDGHEVQADDVVSFDLDKTTLTISSASASRRGEYSCSGKFKSRPVSSSFSSGQTLDVYETKPRVILTQNPIYNVMHTGDSVSFSCHINVSSGWEYLWYKDGSLLHTFGKNHTITPVKTANTGSYTCQAKRGSNTVFQSDPSQAVRLDIKERPKAEIGLLTGWSEVFSTDSLVLRCVVQQSQDTWNYTWFREGKGINLLPSERHIVTPHNDAEQGEYTCQGIRSGRPSYSKTSNSFQTKNLLLKRRVLLSISGCIFFGIIAVFLGCIVLRLLRKKVEDDDKPEEENLFLTMAQLKDCPDAPCPLVEYITDASLNASSKEGDETGMICSETTPLPISPQEDQAVTTESHDSTESNGGLVSFKQ